MQPNAPGTQGFDLYSYVANDTTSAFDPSGHAIALSYVQTVVRDIAIALGEATLLVILAHRLGIGE